MASIEEELSVKIGLDECNWTSDLQEPAENPQAELEKSADIEDVLLDIYATDKEIYFASLKRVLQDKPNFSLNNKDDMYAADVKIMQMLYKEKMEYTRIMQCITYSPKYKDLDVNMRWMMASMRVTKEINPILFIPVMEMADSLLQLNKTILYDEPERIYYAYLKAILERKPDLRVVEADKKITEALVRMKLPEKNIINCLSFSYQFKDGLVLPEDRKKIIINMINDALKNQSPKIKTAIDVKLDNVSKVPEAKNKNQGVYQNMQEKLHNITKDDLVAYWKSVHETIKNTMLAIDQAKIAYKVLVIWSIGLEKSCQEFHMEMDEELLKMKNDLNDTLMKQEEQWKFIYKMADKATSFSEKIVAYAKLQKEEPLLQRDEFVNAKKLMDLKSSAPSKELYCAAVKSVTQKNPEMFSKDNFFEIDVAVVKALQNKHCNLYKIRECLTHSPRLENMTIGKKSIEVNKTVNAAKRIQGELER